MKRTQSFSLYAFIIALLVHLIIALFILLFNLMKPELPPPEKPAEQRFRLSLKEIPHTRPEAPVKNEIPKLREKLPIPSGKQMLRPTPLNIPQKTVPTPPESSRSQAKPQPAPPVPEPLPEPRKAFERHVAKPVATIEKTPVKKEQGLYDILSKADGSAKNVKSITNINNSIHELYGDKFNELSEGEQKYILDNQEIMRRITQEVLNDYGRSKIPDSVRVNDTNMIEFYLHPDGSISDMKLLKNSQLSILDETTKNTILYAYHRYPRPEQKTLIRYRVWYNLTGY